MVHGSCVKMKRVTLTSAKGFVCKVCVGTKEGIVEPSEELSVFGQVDFVKRFCSLGDRLNTIGGSEAAVIARTRIGWIEFGECGELLYGRKFFVKNEKEDLSELHKISNATWEQDMVSGGE